MNIDELIDCIGEVNEQYIYQAERYKPVKRTFMYMAAAWAVIAVSAAGMLLVKNTADISTVTETELTVISETAEPVQTTYTSPVLPAETVQTESKPSDSAETIPPKTEVTTAGTTSETTVTEASPAETTRIESCPVKIEEDTGGISFDSFEQAKNYLENMGVDDSEEEEFSDSIWDYLLSAEGLYILEDMSPDEYEHEVVTKDDITKVYITNEYAETNFEMYGKTMRLYYYYDEKMGKSQLDYAISCVLENDREENPEQAFESYSYDEYGGNGNTVYCYRVPYNDEYEMYHVWQQEGKYFMLRTTGKYYSIDFCNARLCAFGE